MESAAHLANVCFEFSLYQQPNKWEAEMGKRATNFRFRASIVGFLLCLTALSQGVTQELRIVSLAPNWTNVVAALGAAGNLVGVTPDTASFPIPSRGW